MKNEEIYVFFDVDGVLNKESDWVKKYSLDYICVKEFSKLNSILKKQYNYVRYVIISTWRTGLNRGDEQLGSNQILNLKKVLSNEGIAIYDSTPLSDKGRQAEIEFYIKRNNVKEYIVIDDDLSLFDRPQKLKILVPDYKTGFTEKDLKKALKIIKEK